ncbi:MAG TPA: hypothetical protein VFE51_15450 [Verrucomicrobiae bacterium]|nr:hypothetical protein [Verrucomicrobiae bacterium]
MTKVKFATFTALLTAAFVAYLLWLQHQDIIRLRAENQDLREQSAQAGSLRQANERPMEQLRTPAQQSGAENRELLRLRGQVGMLQRAARENPQLETNVEELAQKLKQTEAERDERQEMSPEARMLASKVRLSTVWGHALLKFAKENDGQMPDTLVAAAPYLSDNDLLPSNLRDTEKIGTQAQTHGISIDDFELVYHGSLKSIENPGRILLLRERQAFHTASGGWARTYVYGNGFATTLWSDDGDFGAAEQGLIR